MEQFIVVEIRAYGPGRKLEAKGLWHVPTVMSADATMMLVERILAAMRSWWAVNLDKVGPKARTWHRYVPVKLDGRMAEDALRQCSLYGEEDPQRFIDLRVLDAITGRKGNGEGN